MSWMREGRAVAPLDALKKPLGRNTESTLCSMASRFGARAVDAGPTLLSEMPHSTWVRSSALALRRGRGVPCSISGGCCRRDWSHKSPPIAMAVYTVARAFHLPGNPRPRHAWGYFFVGVGMASHPDAHCRGVLIASVAGRPARLSVARRLRWFQGPAAGIPCQGVLLVAGPLLRSVGRFEDMCFEHAGHRGSDSGGEQGKWCLGRRVAGRERWRCVAARCVVRSVSCR